MTPLFTRHDPAGAFVGLMSGTSLDGVDAVLVRFSQEQTTTLATHYLPFTAELKTALLELTTASAWPVEQFARVERDLTLCYAEAVRQLTATTDRSAIQAIGCHGQTVRHLPAQGFSCQMVNPSLLAAESGFPVAAHFRQKDLALGGQGAPLVPAFQRALIPGRDPITLVNIGGIANLACFNTLQGSVGFDTGPGNTLLDAVTRLRLNRSHDEGGRLAAAGRVDASMLKALLSDPYLHRPPPKSTGPEYFNLTWLSGGYPGWISLDTNDLLATLTEFTAATISTSVLAWQQAGRLICFGGGVHNDFLMSRLQDRMRACSVQTSEALGIHPDFMEATAFAWLARQLVCGRTGNLPEVTGACQAGILGGYYPA